MPNNSIRNSFNTLRALACSSLVSIVQIYVHPSHTWDVICKPADYRNTWRLSALHLRCVRGGGELLLPWQATTLQSQHSVRIRNGHNWYVAGKQGVHLWSTALDAQEQDHHIQSMWMISKWSLYWGTSIPAIWMLIFHRSRIPAHLLIQCVNQISGIVCRHVWRCLFIPFTCLPSWLVWLSI